jgi:tetratricopeptide (TPR) repeat protein
LQRVNPEISAGLADVLARCLRHDPQQRYPDAGGLAIDLRRHLANLPLQAVPNRSLVERWRKWRRRRPHALTVGLLVCLVMAVAAGAGYLFWERQQQRVKQAEQALEDGRDLRHQGRHADASRALARGLDSVRDQAGQGELASRLQAELQATRKAQLRHDLHLLTEQILFTFDSEGRSPQDLRKLNEACRTLWQARAELGDGTKAEGDHLDLAILWADLLVRSAVEPGSAYQEALALLQETEKEFGPNVVLYRERQRYAQALGRIELATESAAQAARLFPRTAWEHYALGRTLLRAGELADAAHHLDQAVALQPHSFWPNFYQGACAHRRGNHTEAIAAFRACITLAPGKAECYFNRALAYQALNDQTAALGDYDQAVQLKPTLATAWLNRGILHLGQNRLEQAARDLDQALRHGSDPALVHYNVALVCQAQGRFDQALTHVRQALQLRPAFTPARELEQRLLTK